MESKTTPKGGLPGGVRLTRDERYLVSLPVPCGLLGGATLRMATLILRSPISPAAVPLIASVCAPCLSSRLPLPRPVRVVG